MYSATFFKEAPQPRPHFLHIQNTCHNQFEDEEFIQKFSNTYCKTRKNNLQSRYSTKIGVGVRVILVLKVYFYPISQLVINPTVASQMEECCLKNIKEEDVEDPSEEIDKIYFKANSCNPVAALKEEKICRRCSCYELYIITSSELISLCLLNCFQEII